MERGKCPHGFCYSPLCLTVLCAVVTEGGPENRGKTRPSQGAARCPSEQAPLPSEVPSRGSQDNSRSTTTVLRPEGRPAMPLRSELLPTQRSPPPSPQTGPSAATGGIQQRPSQDGGRRPARPASPPYSPSQDGGAEGPAAGAERACAPRPGVQ